MPSRGTIETPKRSLSARKASFPLEFLGLAQSSHGRFLSFSQPGSVEDTGTLGQKRRQDSQESGQVSDGRETGQVSDGLTNWHYYFLNLQTKKPAAYEREVLLRGLE